MATRSQGQSESRESDDDEIIERPPNGWRRNFHYNRQQRFKKFDNNQKNFGGHFKPNYQHQNNINYNGKSQQIIYDLKSRIREQNTTIIEKDLLVKQAELMVLTRDEDIKELQVRHEREINDIERAYERKIDEVRRKCEKEVSEVKKKLRNCEDDVENLKVILMSVNNRNEKLVDELKRLQKIEKKIMKKKVKKVCEKCGIKILKSPKIDEMFRHPSRKNSVSSISSLESYKSGSKNALENILKSPDVENSDPKFKKFGEVQVNVPESPRDLIDDPGGTKNLLQNPKEPENPENFEQSSDFKSEELNSRLKIIKIPTDIFNDQMSSEKFLKTSDNTLGALLGLKNSSETSNSSLEFFEDFCESQSDFVNESNFKNESNLKEANSLESSTSESSNSTKLMPKTKSDVLKNLTLSQNSLEVLKNPQLNLKKNKTGNKHTSLVSTTHEKLRAIESLEQNFEFLDSESTLLKLSHEIYENLDSNLIQKKPDESVKERNSETLLDEEEIKISEVKEGKLNEVVNNVRSVGEVEIDKERKFNPSERNENLKEFTQLKNFDEKANEELYKAVLELGSNTYEDIINSKELNDCSGDMNFLNFSEVVPKVENLFDSSKISDKTAKVNDKTLENLVKVELNSKLDQGSKYIEENKTESFTKIPENLETSKILKETLKIAKDEKIENPTNLEDLKITSQQEEIFSKNPQKSYIQKSSENDQKISDYVQISPKISNSIYSSNQFQKTSKFSETIVKISDDFTMIIKKPTNVSKNLMQVQSETIKSAAFDCNKNCEHFSSQETIKKLHKKCLSYEKLSDGGGQCLKDQKCEKILEESNSEEKSVEFNVTVPNLKSDLTENDEKTLKIEENFPKINKNSQSPKCYSEKQITFRRIVKMIPKDSKNDQNLSETMQNDKKSIKNGKKVKKNRRNVKSSLKSLKSSKNSLKSFECSIKSLKNPLNSLKSLKNSSKSFKSSKNSFRSFKSQKPSKSSPEFSQIILPTRGRPRKKFQNSSSTSKHSLRSSKHQFDENFQKYSLKIIKKENRSDGEISSSDDTPNENIGPIQMELSEVSDEEFPLSCDETQLVSKKLSIEEQLNDMQCDESKKLSESSSCGQNSLSEEVTKINNKSLNDGTFEGLENNAKDLVNLNESKEKLEGLKYTEGNQKIESDNTDMVSNDEKNPGITIIYEDQEHIKESLEKSQDQEYLKEGQGNLEASQDQRHILGSEEHLKVTEFETFHDNVPEAADEIEIDDTIMCSTEEQVLQKVVEDVCNIRNQFFHVIGQTTEKLQKNKLNDLDAVQTKPKKQPKPRRNTIATSGFRKKNKTTIEFVNSEETSSPKTHNPLQAKDPLKDCQDMQEFIEYVAKIKKPKITNKMQASQYFDSVVTLKDDFDVVTKEVVKPRRHSLDLRVKIRKVSERPDNEETQRAIEQILEQLPKNDYTLDAKVFYDENIKKTESESKNLKVDNNFLEGHEIKSKNEGIQDKVTSQDDEIEILRQSEELLKSQIQTETKKKLNAIFSPADLTKLDDHQKSQSFDIKSSQVSNSKPLINPIISQSSYTGKICIEKVESLPRIEKLNRNDLVQLNLHSYSNALHNPTTTKHNGSLKSPNLPVKNFNQIVYPQETLEVKPKRKYTRRHTIYEDRPKKQNIRMLTLNQVIAYINQKIDFFVISQADMSEITALRQLSNEYKIQHDNGSEEMFYKIDIDERIKRIRFDLLNSKQNDAKNCYKIKQMSQIEYSGEKEYFEDSPEKLKITRQGLEILYTGDDLKNSNGQKLQDQRNIKKIMMDRYSKSQKSQRPTLFASQGDKSQQFDKETSQISSDARKYAEEAQDVAFMSQMLTNSIGTSTGVYYAQYSDNSLATTFKDFQTFVSDSNQKVSQSIPDDSRFQTELTRQNIPSMMLMGRELSKEKVYQTLRVRNDSELYNETPTVQQNALNQSSIERNRSNDPRVQKRSLNEGQECPQNYYPASNQLMTVAMRSNQALVSLQPSGQALIHVPNPNYVNQTVLSSQIISGYPTYQQQTYQPQVNQLNIQESQTNANLVNYQGDASMIQHSEANTDSRTIQNQELNSINSSATLERISSSANQRNEQIHGVSTDQKISQQSVSSQVVRQNSSGSGLIRQNSAGFQHMRQNSAGSWISRQNSAGHLASQAKNALSPNSKRNKNQNVVSTLGQRPVSQIYQMLQSPTSSQVSRQNSMSPQFQRQKHYYGQNPVSPTSHRTQVHGYNIHQGQLQASNISPGQNHSVQNRAHIPPNPQILQQLVSPRDHQIPSRFNFDAQSQVQSIDFPSGTLKSPYEQQNSINYQHELQNYRNEQIKRRQSTQQDNDSNPKNSHGTSNGSTNIKSSHVPPFEVKTDPKPNISTRAVSPDLQPPYKPTIFRSLSHDMRKRSCDHENSIKNVKKICLEQNSPISPYSNPSPSCQSDETTKRCHANKTEISKAVIEELTHFYEHKAFGTNNPKMLFKEMARTLTHHFHNKNQDVVPERKMIHEYIFEVFYQHGIITSSEQFLLKDNNEK